MNRTDFQTGGIVLLAVSVVFCALAVAVLLPLINGKNGPQLITSRSKRGTSTQMPVLERTDYSEFYPTGKKTQPQTSRAGRSTGTRSASPGRVSFESGSPSKLASKRTQFQTNPFLRSVDVSPKSMRKEIASPQQLTTRRKTESHAEIESDLALSTAVFQQNPKPNQQPSNITVQRHDQPKSQGSTRVSQSETYRTRHLPPGSVYAPVTVHPVTVNVDGSMFAEQIKELCDRLDAVATADTPEKHAGNKRSHRRTAKAMSRKDRDDLARIGDGLQKLASSFQELRSETQERLQEVSEHANRTHVAAQMIESYQRAWEVDARRIQQIQSPVRVAVVPVQQPVNEPQRVIIETTPASTQTQQIRQPPAYRSMKTQEMPTPAVQTAPAITTPSPELFPPRKIHFDTPSSSESLSIVPASEPSRPEPSRPEPSRPEPSRPEPSRPEPSRPEPSRPEPSRPEPSRREPSRREPSRREPASTEPASTKSVAPETQLDLPELLPQTQDDSIRTIEMTPVQPPAKETTLQISIPSNLDSTSSLTVPTDNVPPKSTAPNSSQVLPSTESENAVNRFLPTRKTVTPVGFEHSYRFEMAVADDGTSKVVPTGGPVCPRCGKVHSAGTPHRQPSGSILQTSGTNENSKSVQQPESARRDIRHAGRRSNRMRAADSMPAGKNAAPTERHGNGSTGIVETDKPSFLHRVSSTIRQLGRGTK